MHKSLLKVIRDEAHDTEDLYNVIHTARVVYDFFNVYHKFEPDALIHSPKLMPLLKDIRKGK